MSAATTSTNNNTASAKASDSSSSPYFNGSLGNPQVDWVDILDHFIDGGDKENDQHHHPTEVVNTTGNCPNPLKKLAQPKQHQPTPKHQPHIAPAPAQIKNVAPSVQYPPLPPLTNALISTSDSTPIIEKGLSAEEKAKVRSERKRSREKQRRTDVNTQYANLTALLKKIDAEDAVEDGPKVIESSSSMNRVDLISKTIYTLTRIHNDNKRRKKSIEDLETEVKTAQKKIDELSKESGKQSSSDHVMMMVPMMVRSDGKGQPTMMPQAMPFFGMGGEGAFNMQHMCNPFMLNSFAQNLKPSESQQGKSDPVSSNTTNSKFDTPAVNNDKKGEDIAHCA